MPEDVADQPSGSNSHEKNVKVTVESILGVKTSLRKVKKSADDRRRDVFCQVIAALESAETREFILKDDFDLDLCNYNDTFHTAIDGLMELLFNKPQLSYIQFYLGDRFDDEGGIRAVELPDGQQIVFENPAILYEFIKNLK